MVEVTLYFIRSSENNVSYLAYYARLTRPRHQCHPLRAVALSKDYQRIQISKEYGIWLTGSRATPLPLSTQRIMPSSDNSMDTMFSLQELQGPWTMLDRPSSSGIDGVTYSAPKRLIPNGQEPLTIFFSYPSETGVIPADWKNRRLLKPDKSPLCLSSSRPGTLASCVSNVILFRM